MKQSLSTVEHALSVLELFSPEKPWYTIQELLSKTGLARSTLYRTLSVLINRDFLEKQQSTNRYTLGMKVISLASTRINDLELLTESQPFMFKLYGSTGLTTQLCILKGTEVLYLEEINHMNFRSYTYRGTTGPVYCSSLGKCLLSSLSGDELDALFRDIELKPYTPNTITKLNNLKREIGKARKQEYAINDGEFQLSLVSIAVPIYDYNGDICAAISLGAHRSTGLIDTRIRDFLPHLKNAAMGISKRLGYHP